MAKLFDKSLLAELITTNTWMDRRRRILERNNRHRFELMGPYINPLWHQMTLIDDCIFVDNRLEVPRQWRPAVLKRKADHCGQNRKSGKALTKPRKGKVTSETPSTVKTASGALNQKSDFAQAKVDIQSPSKYKKPGKGNRPISEELKEQP